jgi:hypothetical protein
VLSVLKQSTRTKVCIIVDNKTYLDVILWVRSRYLGSGLSNWSLFLHLQDFGELLATTARLEQRRNNQAFKLSLIFVVIFRFCLWKRRGGRGSKALVKT